MGLTTINDLITQPAEMVAKYMAWASDLGDMYDKFIMEDEDDVSFIAGWHGAKSRGGGIHASELSGDCRRPVYYSLLGTPREDRELSPFWKKRFRAGHMYHAMIQDDFRRMCEKSGGLMSFEKEVKISPALQEIAARYDIQSSSDGVITFRDHAWGEATMRVGLEIKTESPDQYSLLKAPKEMHQRQACVYMRCLDLPLIWTMYINKGNQNIVPSKYPYLFAFDFRLWEGIEQEMKDVTHLSVVNEEPPRTEGIGCEFCGYSATCDPDYLKRKKKKDEGKKLRADLRKRTSRGGIRTPKELL